MGEILKFNDPQFEGFRIAVRDGGRIADLYFDFNESEVATRGFKLRLYQGSTKSQVIEQLKSFLTILEKE